MSDATRQRDDQERRASELSGTVRWLASEWKRYRRALEDIAADPEWASQIAREALRCE